MEFMKLIHAKIERALVGALHKWIYDWLIDWLIRLSYMIDFIMLYDMYEIIL